MCPFPGFFSGIFSSVESTNSSSSSVSKNCCNFNKSPGSMFLATEELEEKRRIAREKNLRKADKVKEQEEEARRLRKESNAKKNRFYETSAERNSAWTDSAKEQVKTERLKREKEVQTTKANVLVKTGTMWPQDAKVLDLGLEQFIGLVASIENEEDKLFRELNLVEASLNANANWNILQFVIKRMILKSRQP